MDGLDVTELSCTDDLHMPAGVIAGLEKRCAAAFGARDSLLLVNGSTAGNIAMLLSLGIGKRVLLGRNCHKSVLSGVALAGHEAVGIFPDEYGVISSNTVAAALDEHPCDAVYLTSPTYDGRVLDIDSIADIVHSHGALLFVDCAHGAHFAFSDSLPKPPTASDAWVVSCHKTMNALTQSAVLNLGGGCPYSVASVRRMLSLVQSSSPSYKLMLSIEKAIEHADGWTEHALRIAEFRKRLSSLPAVTLAGKATAYGFDETRLSISVNGMSGYRLGEAFEAFGIYPEMCDMTSVTLITAPCDPDEWYDRLFDLLHALNDKHLGDAPNKASCPLPTLGEVVTDVRTAILGAARAVPLEDSVGLVSAQAVGIYPPGIATFYPGERISHEAVALLTEHKRLGAKLFGVVDDAVLVCDNGRDVGK